MTHELETMRPNPVWDPRAYEDAVATFTTLRNRVVVKVWCGDWCSDCRSLLPDFSAALSAADVPSERIEEYPVEKAADGSKVGPKVETYGIQHIPTVVVELEGTEVARFVEDEGIPIAVYLADQLREREEP